MSGTGEERGIRQGTTALRPKKTASRPEMRKICNADD